MKTLLSLPALLLLIFLSGCTISKMETASTDEKDKEESVAKKRDYQVSEKENIARVSFIQSFGEDNKNEIEITFNRTSNANPPKDFQFRGSSGEIVNTPTFRGFQNVEFPFTGTVIYKVKPRLSKSKVISSKQSSTVSNSSQDLISRLTFTINKPGNWTVNVSN